MIQVHHDNKRIKSIDEINFENEMEQAMKMSLKLN